MTIYVLICLCLSLAGVAGLQFFYLAYLERVENEHKKYIQELERRCSFLSNKLHDAEIQLTEQAEILGESVENEDEEVWADVIEDR